jgi:hypothetical protein
MKVRYRSIKVKEEIYQIIKSYSERHKVPISTTIAHAVTFLDQQERRPRVKEALPLADKVSWYITKVLMSAGAFKENPSERNFNYLLQNLSELRQRLGVEVSFAEEATKRLYGKKREDWSPDDRMEFNAAFKSLVLQMLWILETAAEHSQNQQKK